MFERSLRLLTALAVVFALHGFAAAQGLVQIAFQGAVAPAGGARVEVDLVYVAVENGEERRMELGVHLAQNTSATELAQLVERELKRRNVACSASSDALAPGAAGPRGSLFVERVLFVGLRLGQGLQAQVCLCEDAPGLVRFLSPLEKKEAAKFSISASTEHPHSKERVRFDLSVDFTAAQTGAVAADTLTTASIAKGWTASWQGNSAWKPAKLQSGARVTGTCLTLESAGDWRVEIELERRDPARQ